MAAGCLALANCSGGLSGKLDPRYGVSASARVVEPGQPVPKGGGVYRVGKPYVVAGREYVPQEDINYSAVGLASWYGDDFHGRYTANGEIFDMNSISAAHPTLPLPSYVRVTNLANHRSIIVRVNDRGPYVGNRVIDLSVQHRQAARLLRRRPRQGEGRICRPRAARRLRRPQARGDLARAGAPAAGTGRLQQGLRADLFRQPAADRSCRPTCRRRPTGRTGWARAPARFRRRRARTVELAAASRPQPEPRRRADEAPPAEPQVSPVSAYAPTRYDGRAGLISGRGLY